VIPLGENAWIRASHQSKMARRPWTPGLTSQSQTRSPWRDDANRYRAERLTQPAPAGDSPTRPEANTTHRPGAYVLVLTAVGLLAVGDAVGHIQITSTITASAVITLVGAIALAAAFPAVLAAEAPPLADRHVHNPRMVSRGGVPVLLVLFLAWAFTITLTNSVTSAAIQNLSVYLLFTLCIFVTSRRATLETGTALLNLVVMAAWVRAVTYGADLALFGVNTSGIYERRSIGIEGVLLIAMLVPNQSPRRSVRLLPYALFIEIVLSGSRTAMATAALLLLFIVLRGQRRGRLGKAALVAAATLTGLILVVRHSSTLQQRFFGGDASIHVGGVNVNATGRLALWRPLIAEAKRRMWTGYGAGTATNLIRQLFPTSGEPHNDYIRFWHDFGLVGAALWIAGIAFLMLRCVKRGRNRSGESAGVHYAAAIGLAGMLFMSTTDNVVIYFYFMIPLGVLVGASLAHPLLPGRIVPIASTRSRGDIAFDAAGAGHRTPRPVTAPPLLR
jgi:O-antigen ligase